MGWSLVVKGWMGACRSFIDLELSRFRQLAQPMMLHACFWEYISMSTPVTDKTVTLHCIPSQPGRPKGRSPPSSLLKVFVSH